MVLLWEALTCEAPIPSFWAGLSVVFPRPRVFCHVGTNNVLCEVSCELGWNQYMVGKAFHAWQFLSVESCKGSALWSMATFLFVHRWWASISDFYVCFQSRHPMNRLDWSKLACWMHRKMVQLVKIVSIFNPYQSSGSLSLLQIPVCYESFSYRIT